MNEEEEEKHAIDFIDSVDDFIKMKSKELVKKIGRRDANKIVLSAYHSIGITLSAAAVSALVCNHDYDQSDELLGILNEIKNKSSFTIQMHQNGKITKQ